MDEDGYFWYQARTDDMIISAGYNIAGPEIEMRPARTPQGRANAPSWARPTASAPRSSRRSSCCATGDDGSEALTRELQEFVKAQIAPYKYPRAIEYVAALPRTETGKVQRFRLREHERERAQARAAAAPDKSP